MSPDGPRWVLDRNSDVWARWVSDGLYHQGNRTASLADVVKHYGPVQTLVLGDVIYSPGADGRARCGSRCVDPGGPHRRDCDV